MQTVYTFPYEEVLADSKLVDIIYSINPSDRQWLVRIPSRRSQEYWWLIQIITPINRLPSELLQQILLISIDNANHSLLVSMLVCRHWHTIATGIWAPLKLSQQPQSMTSLASWKESRHRVRPWSHQPIRACTTLFPLPYKQLHDGKPSSLRPYLPEHVVDRRLPQRSDAVLSRLRTFKIKSACERSPLLDRLLRILGTLASDELVAIETNSPSVISFLAPTYPSIFNSVKVLSVDAPGLHNPVDLLPHLHQLEELCEFDARKM